MAAAIPAPSPAISAQRADLAAPDDVRKTRAAGALFARALSTAAEDATTTVAPIRTRLDSGQASDALRAAWESVVGEAPSEKTVRVLTAQWAHETGGGASMFNYNFGGIKGAGPSGLSVAQRTHEGYGANERSIVDRFRAYRTAEEGASDYVRLLSKRFPEAVEAARAGDPVAFVHGLKTRGYFTGDPAAYTRSVVSLSGIEPTYRDGASAPPVLNAPPASIGSRVAPASEYALFGASGGPTGAPLVDALALADEISRAALRIAATSDEKGRRG